MKPDTTPPVSPATEPTVNAPSPLPADEAMNPPIPEEILEEWRWIMKGRDEGLFDE